MWMSSWMTRGCGLMISYVALCDQRQTIMMQRNNRPPLKKTSRSSFELLKSGSIQSNTSNFKCAFHSIALLKTHTLMRPYGWGSKNWYRSLNRWACLKMNNTKSHEQSSQTGTRPSWNTLQYFISIWWWHMNKESWRFETRLNESYDQWWPSPEPWPFLHWWVNMNTSFGSLQMSKHFPVRQTRPRRASIISLTRIR